MIWIASSRLKPIICAYSRKLGQRGLLYSAARAKEFGAPRLPSIREYFQLIGYNCEEALTRLNAVPKRY